MASRNVFVPENDVTGRLPDGRSYLVAPAGVPILLSRAEALGLLPAVLPQETKAPPRVQPPPEGVEPSITMATPSALQLAKENGIDLDDVQGSGKDGRVTKSDVEGLLD